MAQRIETLSKPVRVSGSESGVLKVQDHTRTLRPSVRQSVRPLAGVLRTCAPELASDFAKFLRLLSGDQLEEPGPEWREESSAMSASNAIEDSPRRPVWKPIAAAIRVRIRAIRESKEKPFSCAECGAEEYSCRLCPMKFRPPSQLSLHKCIHLDQNRGSAQASTKYSSLRDTLSVLRSSLGTLEGMTASALANVRELQEHAAKRTSAVNQQYIELHRFSEKVFPHNV